MWQYKYSAEADVCFLYLSEVSCCQHSAPSAPLWWKHSPSQTPRHAEPFPPINWRHSCLKHTLMFQRSFFCHCYLTHSILSPYLPLSPRRSPSSLFALYLLGAFGAPTPDLHIMLSDCIRQVAAGNHTHCRGANPPRPRTHVKIDAVFSAVL